MIKDVEISRAIIEHWTERFINSLKNDVVIVGAGPSGLTAAWKLAEKGIKVTVFERALKPGGGLPGGGMMFSDIVVQKEATEILQQLEVSFIEQRPGYFVADANEILGALLVKVYRVGVKLFNLISAEDVVLIGDRVQGLVLNWTAVEMAKLHVDPLTVYSKVVIDATGHAAEVVNHLIRKAKVRLATPSGTIEGERPMWADEAERLTLINTKEVFPGLWVTGMAANAVFGGPRMGPIFGGMFLSGVKVAKDISHFLNNDATIS
ncbi:thiazole biosynthesis protein [candidate division WOR-3 bacterium]|nr:thiazole biosynthesis protein [candidate division WOR-3 bacterium]